MTDDRRNPYLVLGVPYGTSRAEATRAFAERSKRARKDPASPYSVEDLTWALQQVEANLDDPINAVDHLRVPEDETPLRDPTGPGVLRLSTTPLSKRASATTSAALSTQRDAVNPVPEPARVMIDPNPIPPHPGSTEGFRPDETPTTGRARWAIFVVLAILIAAGVVAAVAASRGDDEAVASSPSLAPVTTIQATVLATTPATTTTEIDEPPIVGERIEVDGLTLTAFNPIDAYGLMCVLFAVVGDDPLVFLPEFATVTMADGTAVQPMLDITTGRAAVGPVYGEASPQQREVCWPAEGWATNDLTISYDYDGKQFEWTAAA